MFSSQSAVGGDEVCSGDGEEAGAAPSSGMMRIRFTHSPRSHLTFVATSIYLNARKQGPRKLLVNSVDLIN